MATELLRVNGISAGTEEKSILHSIDLSIGDGQAHVLMGPNGAGKSTLGRVIMGDPTYKITDGSLIFNGEDVTEISAPLRASSSPTRRLLRFLAFLFIHSCVPLHRCALSLR